MPAIQTIWGLLDHDLPHAGELSLLLGADGLPGSRFSNPGTRFPSPLPPHEKELLQDAWENTVQAKEREWINVYNPFASGP